MGEEYGRYTFEIRKLRVRDLTEEEQEYLEPRIAPLRDYRPPPLPERLRSTFVYAVCGFPPSVGGWEGFLDELARTHFNGYTGPGDWYADMVHAARLAEPRGIMLFPWPRASFQGYQGTWATAGPEASRRHAARQIAEAEGLSAIAGWYLADEPSLDYYVGLAGLKAIYGELDPERAAFAVHFSTDRLKYWDRFSAVNTSDMYPLQRGRRDPWAIAEWCREIDQFSETSHWLWPQAFGDPDTPDELIAGYLYPTAEEFRLMMHLALANGVKGFLLYNHWHRDWMALVDRVGNLTSLGQEASRLGKQWIPIASLLVETQGLYDPLISTQATGGAERGISVGAMGEAQTGPLFLVATNESLEVEQGAAAQLPAQFVQPDRSVYDLHTLRPVAPAGSATFEIAPLRRGDGRIYLLGNPAQFTAARERILANRVQELLRVPGADRELARGWRVQPGLEDYDRAVGEVHALLQARSYREAGRRAEEAGRALQESLRAAGHLGETAAALAEVKETLGRLECALFRYHYDEGHSQRPREGMEVHAEPFEALCERYSRARYAYLRGPFAGPWVDARAGGSPIRAAAETLLAEVQAFAAEVTPPPTP